MQFIQVNVQFNARHRDEVQWALDHREDKGDMHLP